MQRIYDVPRSKKSESTEYFELREKPAVSDPSFDMIKAPYKIPSSSAMGSGNKTYRPMAQTYQDDDGSPDHRKGSSYVAPRSLHCIVIADHIMDCPLCSRFYRNYTPFYNIIIMVLLIILIFLFIRCQKMTILASTRT